jgi:hypothetical protein
MNKANKQAPQKKSILTDANSKANPQAKQPQPKNIRKGEQKLLKGNDRIKDDNRKLLKG